MLIAVNSPIGRAAGIRLDSVLMTDNLATVLEREIDSKIGHLTDMTEVDVALKHTLGVD
jgi:mRNA interferase MazF